VGPVHAADHPPAQRLSHTGSFGWTPSDGELHWSDENFRIFEIDRAVKPTMELVLQRIHPDDRALMSQAMDETSRGEKDFDVTTRLLMRAEQAERALHQAREELAHLARVATLGELTASITHEVNQPLAGILTNAHAIVRWLDRATPDIAETRLGIDRIIRDAKHAADVIRRTRDLFRKAEPEKVRLDINAVISDAISLVHHEALSNRVSLRLELASGLPPVSGDRVQLQQVIINLAVNGIEAMAGIGNGPRNLLVRSYLEGSHQIVVAVQDRGSGIDPENIEKLFNPFFTTKRNGVGMGLSICRSIIEAHGGRVWASRNIGPGATFQFALSTKDPSGLGSPAN